MVANKNDLPDKKIQPHEVKKLSKIFNVPFVQCSAMTGQGIEEAFYTIIYQNLKPVETFFEKFKHEMR